MVKVEVNPAGGGIGHTQGGRPHQAHRLEAGPEGAQHIHRRGRLVVHVAQIEAQHAVGNLPPFRHAYGVAVEEGAPAQLGGKGFLLNRVVGYPGYRLPSPGQSHHHAEVGDALGEIAGAVDGVNNPGVGGAGVHRAGFFGQDAELGIFGPHQVQDDLLRGQVHVGNDVGAALEADFLVGLKALPDYPAGAVGGVNADFQNGAAALGRGDIQRFRLSHKPLSFPGCGKSGQVASD